MGGVVFLTADHGNAEKMTNPDGTPFTAHSTNPVPFAVIGAGDVKLRGRRLPGRHRAHHAALHRLEVPAE